MLGKVHYELSVKPTFAVTQLFPFLVLTAGAATTLSLKAVIKSAATTAPREAVLAAVELIAALDIYLI